MLPPYRVLLGSAPLAAPTPQQLLQADLRANAVGIWTMENGAALFTDTSAAGNTLTNNNSATQVAGKVGAAANLVAASTQYGSKADNAILSMGAGVSFTIAGWFWANALATIEALAGKTTAATVNGFLGATGEYLLTRYNDDFVYFMVADGATLVQPHTAAVTAGAWHFVCGRRDGVNIGVRLDGNAFVNTASAVAAQDGAGAFCLGGVGATGGDPLDGKLDEWVLVKRALTNTEVDTLYNGGAGMAL